MFFSFKYNGISRPSVTKCEVVGGLSGLNDELVQRIETKISQSLRERNHERKLIEEVFII